MNLEEREELRNIKGMKELETERNNILDRLNTDLDVADRIIFIADLKQVNNKIEDLLIEYLTK